MQQSETNTETESEEELFEIEHFLPEHSCRELETNLDRGAQDRQAAPEQCISLSLYKL